MKFKLKVNKDTFLSLFLYQSGPMVVGFAAAVFLLFCWGALGRERYDKSPRDLIEAARTAQRHIEQTPPRPPEEIQVIDYRDWVEKNDDPIRVEPYALKMPWDTPIFRQRSKRTEPKLFTVRELRGTASVGAVAMADESQTTGGTGAGAAMGGMPGEMGGAMGGMGFGGQQTKGQRWIVITGLVPISEQEKAYDETFRDSLYYNEQVDYPDYRYYVVERARVDPNNPGAELRWQALDLRKALEIQRYWMGASQPQIRPAYLHDRLTFRLPPLVGREWDESIAHAPDIPLAIHEEFDPAGMQRLPGGQRPEEETEDGPDTRDPFGTPTVRRARGMGGAPGMGMEGMPMGMPGAGGSRRRGSTGMGMEGMPMGMPGMGMGMEGMPMGMPGMGMGMEGGMAGMGMFQQDPSYYLFRFFDFNVEPGAHYRYRVRLALYNPNFSLEDRYLQSPELSEKSHIFSDWSEPTEIISVPRDDRLLLASVSATRRPSDEPDAVLFAVHWDKETGQEIFNEFPVALGQWTVFEMERNLYDPRNPQLGGLGGAPGMGMGMEGEGPGMMMPGMEGGPMMGAGGRGARQRPPRRPQNLSEKVQCEADELVLDIDGGEKLPGRSGLTAPGEVLLMTADGVLKVRNDLDDKAAIREQKQPRSLIPGMGGAMPGGGMEGMMMPGMEGMGPGPGRGTGGRTGPGARMPRGRGGGEP